MTRLPDWRARLQRYLDHSEVIPFTYGDHDCCMFAAGAVHAMTGIDPAEDLRHQYETLDQAIALLNKCGHKDFLSFADSRFERIPAAQAAVGDLAAIPGDAGMALGVVGGPHVYVLMPKRLGMVPITSARAAWRV